MRTDGDSIFVSPLRTVIRGALLALLVSSGAADPLAQPSSQRSAAELMDAVMWNRELVGGPFELTDHTGRTRTDRDFRGKLLLVYFGFTHCPDVCPTDLQAIGLSMDRLGADAESVQPLFITLDPDRDTPDHLAEYLPSFHSRLTGLTGSAAAIHSVADAYKVFYRRVDFENSGMDYTVDHSSFIYLIGRDGQYLGFLPPGTSAERIAEVVRPLLAEPASR